MSTPSSPRNTAASWERHVMPGCIIALRLAAVGLAVVTAWGELSRDWGAAPEARSTPPSAAAYEAPRDDSVSVDEDAPTQHLARTGTPEDARLALPHTHGRPVDHLARAHALRSVGDVSGAITECRRAVHDDADDTEALRLLAHLAQVSERPDLALLAWARLGHVEELDGDPFVQQARLLLSLDRAREAIAAGEEAVLRDPEDAEAYRVLGRAHLVEGALPSAILRLEQALHLEPENGHALNNLGLAYLRANENAKAADVLARAAELLPRVAHVHNNLGVAYERLGRTEEAREAYATSTRLSPRYVRALVNSDRVNRLARADTTLRLETTP